VPYLVVDEKMDATEAIRRSWDMTRGHAGTIFLMGLTAFFVALGGLICFIVGIFPAVIWISLAFASIYWVVSSKIKNSAPQV
jgi:type IV secretory pathway TrbD component